MNRRRMLMETSYTKSYNQVIYGNDSTDYVAVDQHTICILWYGVDDGVISESSTSAMFRNVDSLDIRKCCCEEHLIAIHDQLKQYFRLCGCFENKKDWISLQSIAWCIDPENCYKFFKPGEFLCLEYSLCIYNISCQEYLQSLRGWNDAFI